MSRVIQIVFCIGLLYLTSSNVECRAASAKSPLDTWIFLKNNTYYSAKVVCTGAYCDEVQIEVVKCEGVDFEIGYECNSPDIRPDDEFEASYRIECLKEFRNEKCQVDVTLFRKMSPPNNLPLERQEVRMELSLVTLVILFTVGQLLLGAILAPIGYCIGKIATRKAEPKGPGA